MLQEDKRLQLDGIVQQMVANKESDSNIKFVVDDFKQKYTQVEQPQVKQKVGLGQKVLNAGSAVTNFLGGKAVADTFGAEIAKSRATPQEKGFITQPTVGQTAGSALQLGATFLPAGGMASGITGGLTKLGMKTGVSALGKIGSGALVGQAFDTGANLQEGQTGAGVLKPGIGTALGAGIPAAGVAKNALVRLGNSKADRVINSLIKPLAKDFSYGKNPGRAVAEAKIVANDFEELATKINSRRQEVGQEIGQIGRQLSQSPNLSVRHAFDSLDDAMNIAAKNNNPSLLKRLSDVKTAINSVLEPGVDDAGNITIKKVGEKNLDKLDFAGVRKVLGEIGDMTQFTGNPSDDKLVNSALKKAYGQIKEVSLEAADKLDPTLGKQFRKLTEQYADLTSAEIATKYRDKIVERSSMIGLSPQTAGIGTALITMVATGGAATPAVVAGLTAGMVDKLAQTPGFKTRLAALLSKKSQPQVNALFQKVPALRGFFSKPKNVLPGDAFLQGAKQDIKSVVQLHKTTNPEAGFVRFGGETFKEIPDATKREMMGVIDYLRGGKGVDKNMEKTLDKLMEKYKINQKLSNSKISDAFENLIDKTKTK